MAGLLGLSSMLKGLKTSIPQSNFVSTMKDIGKEAARIPGVDKTIDAIKTANSLMNDPFEKKVETVEYMAKQYGGQALDYMNKHKGEIANKALEYGKEKLGEMAKNKLGAIMA